MPEHVTAPRFGSGRMRRTRDRGCVCEPRDGRWGVGVGMALAVSRATRFLSMAALWPPAR